MLPTHGITHLRPASLSVKLKESIQCEMDVISEFALNIGIDNPRIERNNSMGHCLIVTSSQAKAIKQSNHKNIVVKSNASSSRVTFPKIEFLSKAVKSCTQKLFKATLECLLHHTCMFVSVVNFVSIVDAIKCTIIADPLLLTKEPVS